MKYLNTDTVGGRIREIRLGQRKTIKEFAKELGVTGNYLGLVERGDRRPSQALLKQFADTLEVSYDWLINGEPKQEAKLPSPHEDIDPVLAVKPKLFLPIILMYSQANQETLADILRVPVETIDEISKIGDIDIVPDWVKSFPVLAQQADLTVLLNDLRNIELFLQGEDNAKVRQYMYQLLTQLKRKAAEDFKHSEIEAGDWEYDTNISTSMDLCIPVTFMDKKDNAPVWRIKCYPRLAVTKDAIKYGSDNDDDDIDEDLDIRSLYDAAVDEAEAGRCKVSIALRSSEVFDKFCQLNDKFNSEDGANASTDYPVYDRSCVSVIYFDPRKGKFDELLMYDDQ